MGDCGKMVDDRGTRIYVIIDAAAGAVGVQLTASAREMLAIPVMEQYEAGNTTWANTDWEIVGSSVHRIIDAAKRNHHLEDSTDGKLNARAMIRGFWSAFCNIPPFCVAVERQRSR